MTRWLLMLCAVLAGCGDDEAGRLDAAVADAGAVVDVQLGDAAPDASVGPLCAAMGGSCVLGRWANCPPGTQPTDDIHADCNPSGGRGSFCCVPAPTPVSSCAAETSHADCFAGSACTHPCWGASRPALTCGAGRVCCSYICPD